MMKLTGKTHLIGLAGLLVLTLNVSGCSDDSVSAMDKQDDVNIVKDIETGGTKASSVPVKTEEMEKRVGTSKMGVVRERKIMEMPVETATSQFDTPVREKAPVLEERIEHMVK